MRITLAFFVLLSMANWSHAQSLRPTQHVEFPVDGETIEAAISISPRQNQALCVAILDVGGEEQIWAVAGARQDGGKLWEAQADAVRIDGDANGAQKHSLKIQWVDGYFCIGWLDERLGSSATSLYMLRIPDTFPFHPELEKLVPSNDSGVQKDLKDWSLAASGSSVYVLSRSNWSSSRDALFISHSNDGGATWNTPLLATSNAAGDNDVDHFALSVNDNNEVLACWFDNREGANHVYVRRGNGDGWFSAEIPIDDQQQGKPVDGLVATSCGTGFVVAWCQEGVATVTESLWASAFDGGSWAGPQLLGSYLAGVDDVDNPSISGCGDRVGLAWEDNRLGKDQVFTLYSEDGGHSFSHEQQHSRVQGAEPQLLLWKETAVLAWREVGQDNISLQASLDGGENWQSSNTINIGKNPNDADAFFMAGEDNWRNNLVVTLNDATGANQAWLSGFRFGQLIAHGDLTANSELWFDLHAMPTSEEDWWFEVLCSGSYGKWNPALIAPRWIELNQTDSYFARMRNLRWRGKIKNGVATTSVMQVPQLPKGLGLYFVGVSRSEYPWPGGAYGSISDPVYLKN